MDLRTIKNDIPLMVKEWGEENARNTGFSFVGVLEYHNGEIVERAFALRRYAKKGVLITEVRRRATGCAEVIVKNLTFAGMPGYIPIFECKDKIARYGGGYTYKVFAKEAFDVWDKEAFKTNFSYSCLNKEMLAEIEEFKYCGFSGGDVISYLNAYRENHLIEFFGKLKLRLSPLLISEAEKDKAFRKFLFKNAEECNHFGARATLHAYKNGMDISAAAKLLTARRLFLAKVPACKRGRSINIERVSEYCKRNSIDLEHYSDYLNALIELGLDLNDTKNLYPKDFYAMHDMRCAEYAGKLARADRKKRAALYADFAKAGERAVSYEFSTDDFVLSAPRDVSDLILEGKCLGHCVGDMGYDKKMADGKVVIMFVRKKNAPRAPFVTLEYDLKKRKLLQAYGRKNTKPDECTMCFINKWLGVMKKRCKEAV